MKYLATLKITLLISLFAASGHAGIIMLDFGPTTPTDTSLTNSPGHATSAISSSNTTWNVVGTSGGLSGSVSSLLYGDGSAATGLSFTYGSTLQNSKVVDYTGSISSSSALGSGVKNGVYTGDSVAKDGIFNGSGSGSDYSIGIRIDGLSAGNYGLYVTALNTATISSQAMDIFAAVGSSSDSYDYSLDTASTVSSSGSGGSEWVAGTNYVLINVSVGTGDSVFLAVDGVAGGQNRGFLNSLQIVPVTAVPEVSTITLWVGLLISFGAIYVRRFKDQNEG